MSNREDASVEADEERERGHEDIRHKNVECEKPDPHIGCDPGVDAAG